MTMSADQWVGWQAWKWLCCGKPQFLNLNETAAISPDLQRQNSDWMKDLLTESQTQSMPKGTELAHPIKTLNVNTYIIIALISASIVTALMQFWYNQLLISNIRGGGPTAKFHLCEI